jgi:hypothetical protein
MFLMTFLLKTYWLVSLDGANMIGQYKKSIMGKHFESANGN